MGFLSTVYISITSVSAPARSAYLKVSWFRYAYFQIKLGISLPHDMVLPRDLKFTSILSLFNDSRKMETFLYNNCKPCFRYRFFFFFLQHHVWIQQPKKHVPSPAKFVRTV